MTLTPLPVPPFFLKREDLVHPRIPKAPTLPVSLFRFLPHSETPPASTELYREPVAPEDDDTEYMHRSALYGRLRLSRLPSELFLLCVVVGWVAWQVIPHLA